MFRSSFCIFVMIVRDRCKNGILESKRGFTALKKSDVIRTRWNLLSISYGAI
jgi:hypothetical protein